MKVRLNFPTTADFAFWQAKQKAPGWAGSYIQKRQPDIDSCVNAHAGINPKSGEMAAGNLLVILSSYQRRKGSGALFSYLMELSSNPGCAINPEKRAAFARKWALKLK